VYWIERTREGGRTMEREEVGTTWIFLKNDGKFLEKLAKYY
jgi:hypothetical protein